MKNSRLILFAVCCITPCALSAQSFNEQFKKAFAEGDTLAQLHVLQSWQATDSTNAELCVAWFNYYVSMSKNAYVALGYDPQGNDALQLTDSSGTAAGYLYDAVHYNIPILKKGLVWANKGISYYPSRLDIRFGKIHVYGLIKDYSIFTSEIIKTIDISERIQNKWTWTNNEPVGEDAEKFFLENIQTYILQLYNTGDDKLLENMKQIAEAVLRHYPQNVPALSDLSIVYMIREQYDKGLDVLLEAEKIAPEDAIVLNNIAEAYKRKKDYTNAIAYYEKVLKYGDEAEVAQAQDQINSLKTQEKNKH